MILPAPSQTEKPIGQATILRHDVGDTVGTMLAYLVAEP